MCHHAEAACDYFIFIQSAFAVTLLALVISDPVASTCKTLVPIPPISPVAAEPLQHIILETLVHSFDWQVHERACLCLCECLHVWVCFYDVYFFLLFLFQESPSGPLGFPVPACQKRLHLLDPLEAGDSQMSLGPSTEW